MGVESLDRFCVCLEQGSPNYGPLAGCGPRDIFIGPAETYLYK